MSVKPVHSSQFSPRTPRAIYQVLGWRMPAVTLSGLVLVVMVVSIPLLGRPIGWLEWTALATFAALFFLVGVSSLRERWLSLAPLAGFRTRPYRSGSLLRWIVLLTLLLLGSLLLIGGLTQPLAKEKDRVMILGIGGCCLLGTLGIMMISLTARRHVLTREGLALRHRHGWSLLPWDRINDLAVGIYYENVVGAIQITDLLTPLPIAWRTKMSEERRRRWLERQRIGFQQARNWIGADLLIWNWTCGMPPGLFLLQANDVLTDLDARQRLPTFAEATGITVDPVS